MDYKAQIRNWLKHHKVTTLPAWIKRNAEINEYVINTTKIYTPQNYLIIL